MAAIPAQLLAATSSASRACFRAQVKPHRPMRATRLICRAATLDKAQVLADVRSIIAEQLGAEVEKVTPESKFMDLGADSLDTVEILLALEEKFDIQLDEEGAENVSTVQEAAELICTQIK